MSVPLPILSTPTPAAREAFMRAMLKAKYLWASGSGPVNEGQIMRARDSEGEAYVIPYGNGNGECFMFVSASLTHRSYTLVNSIPHYLSYMRRHFTGQPKVPS